jgi:pyruvate dehydrogenase E2 component (dihydrolipoamide acetyltransferase)
MGNYEFKFPDVGEGIQEGIIVSWKVKEGDTVKADQVLGEVETDKAVVEIPSPKAGKIIKLHVKAKNTIKVGETMVTLDIKGYKPEDASAEGAEKAGGVVGFIPEDEAALNKPTTHGGATPAVRRLAKEKGIDITTIKGTGPDGRVTSADVKAATGTAPHSTQKQQPTRPTGKKHVRKYDMYGYIDHLPLKGMRKVISDHMDEAWTVPTVTHMDEADVTELVEFRTAEKVKAKGKGVHLTFLPYIIKAAIEALKKHPRLNAALDKPNEDIIIKKYYNLGIAVDTGDGLIVPVIKGADKKELYAIATEIENFAEHAKDRKIDIGDMKGGTFTITNIGVLGGLFFTPVVNSPEVAILGVGKIYDKAVVKDGQIVARKVMPLTISFDHRVTDGADAARFMNDLMAILENPKKIK